jgi:SAM-dependent methyltransferase
VSSGPNEDLGSGHDLAARIVRSGYDAVATAHLEWLSQIEGDPRLYYLEQLATRLVTGASVLELGCGAGVPITVHLADRFDVVGVDLSETQLSLARERLPDTTFVPADMTTFTPDRRFDAVVAAYSITHVPRSAHSELFAQIASWLEPGGFFLASLGAAGCPDTVEEWLGVPMFFSSFDADENRRLLVRAGFDLLIDDVVTMREPEGPATFLWVLCRRSEPL